jgi:hypothetical protein
MNRLLVDLRRYVLLFVYNMFEYQEEEISHILRLWVCSYGSIEFIDLCDSVDTAR